MLPQDLIKGCLGAYDFSMSVQIPSDAVCKGCKKSLERATQSYCPECGRDFNPMDSATFEHFNGSRWAYWAQPPLHVTLFVTIGMTCLLINDASMPGPSTIPFVCLCIVLSGLVFVDLLLRICCVVSVRLREVPIESRFPRRSRWHWAILPICVAVVASTHFSDWPLLARFRLSKAAFDQAAATLRKDGVSQMGPQWLGWYKIRGGYKNHPKEVWFVTGSYGVGLFRGNSGFLHIQPAGASSGFQNREDLYDGWFTFR